MRQTLWQRLDLVARSMTPFGLTLVLVLIGVLPLHIPGYARVAPMFALMAIYHWAIYRPELMPAVAVFLIGLLQDILMGLPLGVNALVFLTVYGTVLSQRRFLFGKSFAIVWLAFFLVAAGAALETWALVSAFNAAFVGPRAVIFEYLVTVGCFPLIGWTFSRWQQTFLRA